MVSGGMSCIKYLLFAFNLVFVIFGILLVYAGFTTVAQIGHYEELLEDAPNNAAIALIVVGFAIFALAFLGCCGAIKESSCMLTSFSSIILFILLIELIGAGLIFAFKSKLRSAAEEGIKKIIKDYGSKVKDTKRVDDVMDEIQNNLKCCGARNATDWDQNETFNKSQTFPHSCCDDPISDPIGYPIGNETAKHCTKQQHIYPKGCVDAINNEIRSSFGLLGGIAIAVAVIQLIGVIFACSLSRTIKKEYEVV